jgi:hypothetical protein
MSNTPGGQADKSALHKTVGLSLIFGVAVLWVISSFITEKLEKSHKSEGKAEAYISPFYLTYFATSLFTIYLPIVHIKNAICGKSEKDDR